MPTFNQQALLDEVKPFALLVSIEVWWEGEVMWFKQPIALTPTVTRNFFERRISPNREVALGVIRTMAQTP